MTTGVISSRTLTKTARLSEIGGIGRAMSSTGLLYLLGGLALAGVPPLNGFVSKAALVQSGIGTGDWLVLGLVVSAGMITLLYMMRTWQLIFQRTPDESSVGLKPYSDARLAPTLLIGACIALGLFAAPVLDIAARAVAQLGDPQLYIRAVLGG